MRYPLSRWMNIVFWSQDQLEELHRLEKMDRKHGIDHLMSAKPGRYVDNHSCTYEWQINDQIFTGGYWHEKMTMDQRDIAVDEFLRKIYPIHQSISERSAGDDYLDILHHQDIAIRQSGIMPNRFGAGADMDVKKRRLHSDFMDAMG